jgi:hypothetical protein
MGAVGGAALGGLGSVPETRAQIASEITNYVELIDGIGETAPASGRLRLSAKTADKMLYIMDDGGVETIAVTRQVASYVIELIGSTVYARPAPNSGLTPYSGSDAYTVIQAAINALTNGGRIFVRTGTYTLSQALLFSGSNYTTKAWIIQGEGLATVLSQTNSGLNAVIIKNGTNVSLYDISLYGGSSAGDVVYLDPTGTDQFGHHATLYGGKWDNVYIYGGANGHYLFNGINIYYCDFGYLYLVSSTAGCIPFRIYSDDATCGVASNNHFGYIYCWVDGADGFIINGPQQGGGLNSFDSVQLNGSGNSGHKGIVLGRNASSNTFCFVSIESFDDGIYAGTDYLDGGTGQTPFANAFLSGYVGANVNCIHQSANCSTNVYKNLFLAPSGHLIRDEVGWSEGTVFEDLSWFSAGSGVSLGAREICRGNRFQSSGVVKISSGSTSASVTHGLVGTPTVFTVSGDSSDTSQSWITSAGATTFIINVPNPVGADRYVSWTAAM